MENLFNNMDYPTRIAFDKLEREHVNLDKTEQIEVIRRQIAFKQHETETKKAENAALYVNNEKELIQARENARAEAQIRIDQARAKDDGNLIDKKNTGLGIERNIELTKGENLDKQREVIKAQAQKDYEESENEVKLQNQRQHHLLEKQTAEEEHKKAFAEQQAKLAATAAAQQYAHQLVLQQDAHGHEMNMRQEVTRFLSDPKKMGVVVGAIGVSLALYYGLPVAANYIDEQLRQPQIISETSITSSWFGSKQTPTLSLDDYVMNASMKNRLLSIFERIETAQANGQKPFNMLFCGEPGTGKTMLAKIIASATGCHYIYMSASEIVKDKDVGTAIGRFQKGINFARKAARKTGKPVIIIWDEVERVLADRRLQTTSPWVADFINAFLAAIPEASDDELMFIFSTNNPFMIDEAIVSRIGETIEFGLPDQAAGVKIIQKKLGKMSAMLTPGLEADLGTMLDGFTQRDIAYISEKMVQVALQKQGKGAPQTPPNKNAKLPPSKTKIAITKEIAQTVIAEQKDAKVKAAKWKEEKRLWQAQTPAVRA